MTIDRRITALACAACALTLPTAMPEALAATAAPPAQLATIDQDATTKDLVERLVLDRAASLARSQRKADEREQQLLDQLEQKDRSLRRALTDARASGRQTAQLRADLAGVTAERERLVSDLTQRDSTFKTELTEYRRLIAELANSPNPERRQALERYADGDRTGAFVTLKELTRIEEAAGEKAVKLRAAARHREQAVLAADMKDRGDAGVTTLTVLAEWEAAADRDAGDFATWAYISRLREEAGRTDRAIKAARELQRIANTDLERSVAFTEMGHLQISTGDLPAAVTSFTDSLQIARRSAVADPSSFTVQRNVSVHLGELGVAQVAAGDLAAAIASFTESLQIDRRIAGSSPSDNAQRDVAISWARLGDAQVQAADLTGADASFSEALQIYKDFPLNQPRIDFPSRYFPIDSH